MSRVKYHTKCGCVYDSIKELERVIDTLESGKKAKHHRCQKHKGKFSHRMVLCVQCGKWFRHVLKDRSARGAAPERCSPCKAARIVENKNRRLGIKSERPPEKHWCNSYDEFCSGKDGHCIMPIFNCKIGLKQIRQEARNAAF